MGKVAVIHPDLGLGGAERLIVDASRALQELGHSVKIYTFYHNKDRCFEETRDGTLDVTVVGGWLPRTIFGRCHALVAYLKIIYIAVYLLFISEHEYVLCDQISACIPILRLRKNKIIFYCHYPDQLLTDRRTILKSLYRKGLDWFERWSTFLADIILVNSSYTEGVVKHTFKTKDDHKLDVLYPCVDVNYFRNFEPKLEDCREIVRVCENKSKDNFIFLSLNRFERKKDLGLAIEGLADCMLRFEQNTGGQVMKAHLIVAGGYDQRLLDSKQYYVELRRLVDVLGLKSHVTFVESPSENEKLLLLKICNAVVYTPQNEHFGIVPLEAMAMSKAVICCNSGGPLETIEEYIPHKSAHGRGNGLMCDPDKKSFGKAMLELYTNQETCESLGHMGLNRVKLKFSYENFRDELERFFR